MGNNSAFTAFEATVIAAYNKGVLDKELLSDFISVYDGTDIDTGGWVGTLSKDGLNIFEIVCKTFDKPLPPRPDLPKSWKDWTPEQDKENEMWQELRYKTFREFTKGWR